MNDNLTQQIPAGSRQTGSQPRHRTPFTLVEHGYHMVQVDEHVAGLMHRIRELEDTLASWTRRAAESPEGKAAIEDLLRMALEEVAGRNAAAVARTSQMLGEAQSQADQMRAEARQEADGIVSGARQQAETVLTTARTSAKTLLDKATAESAAVSDGAGRRLSALTDRHGQAIERITGMHELLGKLLDAERERGSLQDEVDRALSGTAVVAASAPAQLTAGPASIVSAFGRG